MASSLFAFLGLKGIALIIIGVWLVLALVKRLFKLAVFAVLILVAVYFLYPVVVSAFGAK